MKTVTVNITKECIKNGKRGRVTMCPIANALRLSGVKDPHVDGDHWNSGTTHIGNPTPLSRMAKRFVEDFDRGLAVKPFKFRTRIPS